MFNPGIDVESQMNWMSYLFGCLDFESKNSLFLFTLFMFDFMPRISLTLLKHRLKVVLAFDAKKKRTDPKV
jgi:hypothetical protein